MFRVFDEDGSGEIEFKEFEKLLYKLTACPNLSLLTWPRDRWPRRPRPAKCPEFFKQNSRTRMKPKMSEIFQAKLPYLPEVKMSAKCPEFFKQNSRTRLKSKCPRASEASPVACERSEPRCVRTNERTNERTNQRTNERTNKLS